MRGRHGSCSCASHTSSGSSARTRSWPSVCGSSSSPNQTATSPPTMTGCPPVSTTTICIPRVWPGAGTSRSPGSSSSSRPARSARDARSVHVAGGAHGTAGRRAEDPRRSRAPRLCAGDRRAYAALARLRRRPLAARRARAGALGARLGAARGTRQGDPGGRAGDRSRRRRAPAAAGARLGAARRRRRAAARRGSNPIVDTVHPAEGGKPRGFFSSRGVVDAVLITAVLLVALGWWTYSAVERSLHELRAATLTAMLEAQVRSLGIWRETHQISDGQFATIVSAVRTGETGEAYAFDRAGNQIGRAHV